VNSKIYVIGGTTQAIYAWTPIATNEEYDPSTNAWATKANMPNARAGAGAAAVNNKIYVIGGGTPGTVGINQEYDPATNTWATKAGMPAGARIGLAAAAVNNKIYAIGGALSSFLTTNEEYDPVTNGWTTKAAMPTARGDLTAAVLNSRVYLIGGLGGTPATPSTIFATIEEYDPASNLWVSKASMPTARRAPMAAAVNSKIYVIGGVLSYSYPLSALSTNEEFSPGLLYIHKKN
jgi:N-acetylneuraminic acid mutarotase